MALTAKRPSKADENRNRLIHEITGISEKKARLNTEIEDSIYQQIKMKALQEKRTISQITRQLWLEYLNK